MAIILYNIPFIIYNNCCCNKIDRELLIIIEEWVMLMDGMDGPTLMEKKEKGPAS